MEDVNRWYFTKDQLANTPSRKCKIDSSKELSYRQQAAHFIQDMGQRLQVSQLCINTAIVYMHRFYVFHAFTEVHRNSIAVAALFLAAKVEEQPRKLEHVIKVAHICLHKDSPHLDSRTEAYGEKQVEVVAHENVLLQTLGFVLAIEHPHTYVVKVCQLVKASKDLAQTSYFMATTSLHMTTMCLQYKPTVVACVCIHLACKWSNWKIEPCSEGKEWYYYVDKSVTLELLEDLTKDFIAIMETSPHRFKRKFISHRDGGYHGPKNILDEVLGPSKAHFASENKIGLAKKDYSSPGPSSSLSFSFYNDYIDDKSSNSDASEKLVFPPVQTSPVKKLKLEPHSISLAVYREKREKERLSEQKSSGETSHHTATKSQAFERSTPEKSHSKSHTTELFHITTAEPEKVVKKVTPLPPVTSNEKAIHAKFGVSSEPSSTVKPTVADKVPPASVPDKHHPKSGSSRHSGQIPNNIKDKSSRDKLINIEKQIAKDMISHPPVNRLNHQILEKAPSDANLIKADAGLAKQSTSHSVKNSTVLKMANDPFVLLTRVDQQPAEKCVIPSSLSKQNTEAESLSINSDLKFRNKSASSHEHAVNESLCDIKTSLRTPEAAQLVKSKHQKHKTNLLHNNHGTQGKHHKQSPVKDSIKANGSKEVDATDSLSRHALENNVGGSTVSIKHEKREKHRHKHSSSKDKSSNHLSGPIVNSTPPGGGIKITIPKDKINLSSVRSDSSQKSHKGESPKKTLKIKLPKPPMPEPPKGAVKASPSGTGLKLVLTKDKSGSGSYSTSHKSERESRKRVHNSSASQDHSLKNSHDGAKLSKVTKLDQAMKTYQMELAHNTVPTKQSKMTRHNPHRRVQDQHLAANEAGRLPPQMNDGAQQNYVIPYGQPYYPPAYYPYQQGPPLQPPPPPPSIYMSQMMKANSQPPLPSYLTVPPPPPPE